MTKQIITENYSKIGQRLLQELSEICNDYDFLIGAVTYLKTDENFKKMLDFLNTTKTKDTDIIIPYALKIYKGII